VSHFVFPKWSNALLPSIVVAAIAVPTYAVGLVWFGFSPKTTDVGYEPQQPIPYSHKVHVGQLGMDCRYCHNTVERAAKAAIPPTQTCMNCHNSIQNVPVSPDDPTVIQNKRLQPLVKSYHEGTPVEWARIHDLPGYAYFSHEAHVNRGVSCVECHGRVDRMDVVYQQETLSMGWCLECHRDPEPRLRRPQDIFDLASRPLIEQENGVDLLNEFIAQNHIEPSTDCSTCHR